MSDVAIKVEHLSKQYRIGTGGEAYRTFRETLVDAVKAPFQQLGKAWGTAQRAKDSKEQNSKLSALDSELSSRGDNYIWALRDVSFEVKQGEVVGIIGRNGAGKSTLLKILSKITEPTEGRVELRGRIGSLLEVGTGFHPELTGHENIYLYGAILGMDRWEISRKFDEIVAFAELEKFIDTPVKRYSSGMYMRLAFAVAAHLESEILLVDEILAVGDVGFQKKCLNKISDISKRGRTVLFVSHNLNAVKKFCSRAILIEKGKIIFSGYVDKVITTYMETFFSKNKITESDVLILDSFSIQDKFRSTTSTLNTGDDFYLAFSFRSKNIHSKLKLNIGITIINQYEERLMHITEDDGENSIFVDQNNNSKRIEIFIPRAPLPPGEYTLDIWFGNNKLSKTYLFIQQITRVSVFYGHFTARQSSFPEHVKIPQQSFWKIV